MMRLRREDYSVGWISALQKEQAAVRLEEIHDSPPAIKHDPTYVLGRLAGHNVVLACLSSMGTNAAARCEATLRARFPNLRFLLMVGIGGGVPTQTDIRLGDVVVSMPTKNFPGVCQYDFGARLQGKVLRIGESMLNRPPDVLTSAVAALRLKYVHRDGKNPLGQMLYDYADRLAARSPEMRTSRKPALDELYESDYLHQDERKSCGACDCDETRIVSRSSRGRDVYPQVHQGLIASGNTVMRDAGERDRLAREMGVLCFEMEGSGLMKDMGCLVIRGICDYCDSHKNKGWQDYAAAIAAAYAIELLGVIAPLEISQPPGVTSLRKQEILDWFADAAYVQQQSNTMKKREENTGQWFLQSEHFTAWLDGSARVLYCPGDPGAGKTFITCGVVDHLNSWAGASSNIGVAYYYCSYSRRELQSVQSILASLLRQLLSFVDDIPVKILELYTYHERRETRPSASEYEVAIQATCKSLDRTYIIIDALDELRTDDEGICYKLLQKISFLHDTTNIRFLATARPIVDVANHFQSATKLVVAAHHEDLRVFLQAQMQTLAACVKRNEKLQYKIIERVVEAVRGIFLLARLHMDALKYAMSPKDVKLVLETLPQGPTPESVLKIAYGEAIKRIKDQVPQHQELAQQVIMWITYAGRELRVKELQHALAARPNEDLDEDRIVDVEDLVSVCAGLITVDETSEVMRFVHYTTREFFERIPDIQHTWFRHARSHIAKTCLGYLLCSEFATGPCNDDDLLDERLNRYPLLLYATLHWGRQAAEANEDDWDVLAHRLFEHRGNMLAITEILLCRSKHVRSCSTYAPFAINGLQLAAWIGLASLVRTLLANGASLNSTDGLKRTSLHLAAEQGHVAVVAILLSEPGIDISASDSFGGQALHEAADRGHLEVVRLLLARKHVQLNCKDDREITPLHYAVGKYRTAVVRMLLEHIDTDPNAGDRYGDTALIWALRYGNLAIIQSLLEDPRVDVNCSSNASNDWTPLHWAVYRRNEAFVALILLRNHIDVDDFDPSDSTTSRRTAAEGSESTTALVRLHGSNKVNVNCATKKGWIPLHYAIRANGESVVAQLLCQPSLDVNCQNHRHETPLHLATSMGHSSNPAILEQLLKNPSIDVKCRDSAGRTPLHRAVEVHDTATVSRILQVNSVQVHDEEADAYQDNHRASKVRRIEKLDTTCKDEDGLTPFDLEESLGYTDIVDMLRA